MRRRRTVRSRVEDMTFDLNLAPMLDMMVALVPFLLLSVVFIRLVIIDSPVPQPVADAIEEDRNKKDKNVIINLYVNDDRSIEIKEIINNKKSTYKVSSNNREVNLEELHKKLIYLKKKHQELYSLQLFPAEEISYKEIIKVMDEARLSKHDGPSFEVVNEESDEKVETKFMFPNITFGNVVEG